MSFSQWKAATMAALINLKKKYEDDMKAQQTLQALIYKLNYLRLRDLAGFLMLLHAGSVDVKELLDLVPAQDDVARWFSEGD